MAENTLAPSITMTSAQSTFHDNVVSSSLEYSTVHSSSYTDFLLTKSNVQSTLTTTSTSLTSSVYNNDISTPTLYDSMSDSTNNPQFTHQTIHASPSPTQSDPLSRMTNPVDQDPRSHYTAISSSFSSSWPYSSSITPEYRSLDSSVLWIPTSSAKMTFSDIQPSATFQESMSSSGVVPPPPAVTIKPTIPGSTTLSSTVTDSPKKDLTVLFIAIPVCFVIILVVVGASLYGFNIRKRKKRTMKRYHSRDLWLNPISDISLQGMTSQTVSPPILDREHRATNNNGAMEAKGIRIFKVLYPFEAKLDSQISLQPDDVVSVTEQAENGWYRGEVLGRTGWFPSNYVEEIQPPSLLEVADEENTAKKKSRVTSFLLKKKDKPLYARRSSKTQPINDDDDDGDDESDNDGTDNGEMKIKKDTGVVAEVINMSDIGGITPVIDELDEITKSAGKLFKAVFAYKAACNGEIGLNVGDIVRCYDRDRNGWMNGINLKTNQEGWFPAVYVNEANEEDLPSEATPKPVTYDQLTANRNRDSNSEGVGIEHKAIYTYSSSKSEDLSFTAGDTVVVFETLENGWWLGCKGEAVGWFPGSYVELSDKSDDSSSNASSGLKNFSIFDDFDITSLKSDRSSGVILDDVSGKINKRDSRSALSADFKPARKAPAPPPIAKTTPSGQKAQQSSESLNETKNKQLEKPEPPVRTVKPKIVKVPKVSTKKLKHLSVAPMTEERPLPARPTPSKLKNNAKYKKHKNKTNSFTNNSNDVNNSGANNNITDSKPPRHPNHTEQSNDAKKDRNSLDISLSSQDDVLNTSHNSVGPKILNRISAHLLDEVKDSNNPTPKMSPKLRKVAPPVLPTLMNGSDNEDFYDCSNTTDENRNDFISHERSTKKPPSPKSPPPKVNHDSDLAHDDIPSHTKKTNLRIAVRSFKALEEGELSFEEGSFIMDINEESPRPGWCVGMLADGTTGLYPITHVGNSRSQLQTEL